MIYEALNEPVLKLIPKSTKHLLDVGCGSGVLGKHIKNVTGCRVVGITNSEDEAALAAKNIDLVVVRDINNADFSELGPFDCIVCSHVLEHLISPGTVLRKLHGILDPGGQLIVALPNPLYWSQRFKFLFGRFRYTNGGLMDSSHLHFFDRVTAQDLLTENGYQIIKRFADGCFLSGKLRKLIPISGYLDRLSAILSPGFFGFQFIFVCS